MAVSKRDLTIQRATQSAYDALPTGEKALVDAEGSRLRAFIKKSHPEARIGPAITREILAALGQLLNGKETQREDPAETSK